MNIERRIAKGAAWTVSLRLVERLIGLASVLILARLLTPSDFGLVAMGTLIAGALEAMSTFGFDSMLIQRQAKDRARWNTAWTLSCIIGLVQAVVILALIPLAVLFFSEPRVANVLMILSLCALVTGLRNIGMVTYEMNLDFKRVFALAITRRLSGVLVTLFFALTLGTYWALLLGILANYLTDAVLTYVLSSYRPRIHFSAARELLSFSKWLLLNNLLFFLNNRGSELIIGNRAGAATLGTFTVSNELASLPSSELAGPIMRAVFPGYAMMAPDAERLATGFIKVLSVVVLFVLPAAAGIAFLAEPFVHVLLGAKWTAAIPLIQVLAILGASRAVQANAGAVYVAIGKPYLLTLLTLQNVIIGLGSFAILLTIHSIEAACWGLAGASAVTALANYFLLRRHLNVSGGAICGAFARPVMGIFAMGVSLSFLTGRLWVSDQGLHIAAASLLALIAAGAAVYFAAVAAAWMLAGKPGDSPEQATLTALLDGYGRLRGLRANAQ